jgi:hypothetical protein
LISEISNLTVNPHLSDFTHNIHDHYWPTSLPWPARSAGGRSARHSGFGTIRRQDMDLYDIERGPRAASLERDEREADAAATSATMPFDATELPSSPSQDRDGKTHRARQRSLLIRRLG